MKILAIDNDSHALAQLNDCLKEVLPSIETVLFTDALLAMQYIVNHKGVLDAVFTALLMKPFNGLEFIKYLHEAAPGTAVFAIGQTDTWELRELARVSGANRYLLKPITVEVLRPTFEEFLYAPPLW